MFVLPSLRPYACCTMSIWIASFCIFGQRAHGQIAARQPPPPRQLSSISMLGSPEFAEQLGLAPAQEEALAELRQGHQEEQELQRLELERKYDGLVDSILRPSQREQLCEQRVRCLGVDALLTDESLARRLQLSEHQRFQMTRSHRRAANEAMQLLDPRTAQPDWRRLLPMMSQIMQGRDREILGALTPRQKQQWSELSSRDAHSE